ncbi:hypothetical protein DPMN_098789 [Dreissena polymorpha]|uniref:Uncharacterized protein n=1 Tax=Dreissena polymorpha TaxID=45954 RepID=A0A9D4LDQ8_DREPO|nr:hypothetical protein DPMN_098789 [Dreissena polymorpha]
MGIVVDIPESRQRCKTCLEAGGKDDIVVSIDEGRWFEKKVHEVLSNVQGNNKTTVPVLPVTGWKPFPSTSLPEGYCYDTCEFVVWSPKGMIVETIKMDIEFWEEVLPKLIAFHNNILIPEFLEMRVPRRLMPTEL